MILGNLNNNLLFVHPPPRPAIKLQVYTQHSLLYCLALIQELLLGEELLIIQVIAREGLIAHARVIAKGGIIAQSRVVARGGNYCSYKSYC